MSLKRQLTMLTGASAEGPGAYGSRSAKRVKRTVSLTKRIKKAVEKTKEQKFWDRRLLDGTDVVSTTGNIQNMSAVTQDITDTGRIGDALTATSVEVRSIVQSGSVPAMLRHVVLQWKADNSTAPVISDILDTTVSSAYNASYNHDKKSQYRIIDDFRQVVSPNGPTKSTVVQKYFGKRITKDLRYLAAGTSGYNQLYCISISDAAANGPTVRLDTRMNYTDA